MPTKLTREYRFYLRPDAKYARAPNAWSGAESGMQVAPFLKLRATVTGEVETVLDASTSRQAAPMPGHEVLRVGRNDPCPCGSGKKYKQCHGKLA